MTIYDRALQHLLDYGDEPLQDAAIQTLLEQVDSNKYRLGKSAIVGETEIIFSKSLVNTNYYITIHSYTSNGTIVDYGWNITNQSVDGFTFTPPTRYNEGDLIYEAKYYT